MKDKTYSEVVSEKFIASWQDITKSQKPIIAAVNGYAVFASKSIRNNISWVVDAN
jgi:enoyl-CoA hydratase/carnithine racemase